MVIFNKKIYRCRCDSSFRIITFQFSLRHERDVKPQTTTTSLFLNPALHLFPLCPSSCLEYRSRHSRSKFNFFFFFSFAFWRFLCFWKAKKNLKVILDAIWLEKNELQRRELFEVWILNGESIFVFLSLIN